MTVKDIALVSLFAAIMAVLGLIPKIDVAILPVPITAQTLGVMLAGCALGAVRGASAMALFLALVAAGLPLLAGGRGGLGVFAGPSAGFLLAYPLAAFVIGWITERTWRRLNFWRLFLVNVFGGVVLLYVFGIAGIALVTGVSIQTAALGSLVFLPGDLIKAALAASGGMFVKRGYPLIHARD